MGKKEQGVVRKGARNSVLVKFTNFTSITILKL